MNKGGNIGIYIFPTLEHLGPFLGTNGNTLLPFLLLNAKAAVGTAPAANAPWMTNGATRKSAGKVQKNYEVKMGKHL